MKIWLYFYKLHISKYSKQNSYIATKASILLLLVKVYFCFDAKSHLHMHLQNFDVFLKRLDCSRHGKLFKTHQNASDAYIKRM